jgi:hypothetical protein
MPLKYDTHYQLCDSILRNINRSTQDNVNIKDHLKEPDEQINGSLKLLESEGFIERENQSTFIIHITPKGIDFINGGGYKARIEKNNLQEVYVDKLNNSILSTNTSTRITGICTVIVAAITCLFIALDYSKKQTLPDLLPLNRQLERTSQILDSMLTVQRGIDSSLWTMANDSIKNVSVNAKHE